MNNNIQPSHIPDYSTRINRVLNKAVESKPGGELFQEKFEQIESFVGKFESAPGAVHKIDAKGNAVTTVPDLGSLKRTAKGFEMSILQRSHFSPPLSLAQMASPWPAVGSGFTTTGLNVTYNEKKQEMKVEEFEGGFIMGFGAFSSSSSKQQSQYTLDVKGELLTDLHQSEPKYSDSPEKKFGKDLSLPEPSRVKQFFKDMF